MDPSILLSQSTTMSSQDSSQATTLTEESADSVCDHDCEDCHFRPATRIFLHIDKGRFYLCERCFGWADHEDDYLDYCDCAWPAGDPMDVTCMRCRRRLREAESHCACEKPTVTESERQNCRECGNRIPATYQGEYIVLPSTQRTNPD
jgi:hypothetical protein